MAPSARQPLLALGFATVVAQAVLLREAMAALGGSELAWGSVLALWLAAMGVASRAGVRLGTAAVARWMPGAVLITAGAGVMLLRAAPALTGASPGEALTTFATMWLWLPAVAPAALCGGIAFPVLAAELGSTARAYGLEGVGALIGGVAFTFAMAPFGSSAIVGAGLVIITLMTSRQPGAAFRIAVMVIFAAVALSGSGFMARASWQWSGRPGELGAWQETRQQRLELSSSEPRSLYGNGRLLATYPDPWATAPRTHLMMLLHPRPRRVLAVGTLADGSFSTALAHPVEALHLVEVDPALAGLTTEWYGADFARALADPRVEIAGQDPLRALAADQPWDLILLNDGDPTTLRQNRSRSLEFFRACRGQMAPDGVLAIRLGVSDTYTGGGAGRLVEIMAATLARVFPQVRAVAGEHVLLVAGMDEAALSTDPDELARRWQERGIEDPVFVPELLSMLIDPDRSATLQSFVAAADAPANTTDRPRAVLLATGLVEGRSEGSLLTLARRLEDRSPTPLLVLVAVLCLMLVLGFRMGRGAAGVSSAAVVGAGSMAWWLLLMAAWQSTRGSVYSEVGVLSALFMAGLAGGSLLAHRWTSPEARLAPLLAAGAGLSLVVASGLALRLPLLLVPCFLVIGGGLTGAAFAGAAELSGGGSVRRGAGRGFAADEAGAALAAALIGILAMPWVGITATALGVAALQLAVLPAVFIAARIIKPAR